MEVRGRIRSTLLAHYDRHARDLPWRRTRDPYAVWVSEIMLQQTRVRAAIPFYERWMERFPTVEALALAGPEEVLESWTGLGYYSRARNLRRAAIMVRERFGGRLPKSIPELRSLPGVGEYTAGAIASIAFDKPEPAVDGNVRRVLARLLDLPKTTPATLRAIASELLDPERPGEFNQALMEFGATVCTPRSPACDTCPLSSVCLAQARGTVSERPGPTKRTAIREVAFASFVVVDGERNALLAKRPDKGLLAGMWEFPAAPLNGAGVSAYESALQDFGVRREQVLTPVRHEFTHLRATYHPVLIACPGGVDPVGCLDDKIDLAGRRTLLRDLAGLQGLAVPVGQMKIAETVLAALEASG